ncbi:MAG: DUF2061 domain-containing protein [Nitrospirae bacterium]|nr:MAG: DUF2061 domain-containing protein [Nitrospirota bacterium]
MDSHLRSVVKGVSWRIVATIVTTTVVFVYTGELTVAALLGGADALTKILLYWVHERIWQRIRWGRIIPSVSSP